MNGYSFGLLERAVKQSNMVHMTAMTLAMQLKGAGLITSVVALHEKYADCLQLQAQADSSPLG